MCGPIAIGLAGLALSAATATAAHIQSNQQAADQRGATADAARKAGTAQKATAADTSGLSSTDGAAAAGVNSGPASTLLTGSGGVSNSSLNLGGMAGLGGNTLLGS